MANLSIGSPVWISPPRWDTRGHYKEYKVTGETRVSWVIRTSDLPQADEYKIPKKYTGSVYNTPGESSRTIWLDKHAMDESNWDNRNRRKIIRLLESSPNYEYGIPTSTLRKVAELIGYKEEETKS